MPYIGKSPVAGGFHKLDNLTASATDTYALTLGSAAYYPESANQLLVSLNGVIQAPQDSFTVSGSNIVFDSALTASDSIDFIVALGDVIGVGSVTDGAITAPKIGTDAVTTAKIQAGAVDLTSKVTGVLPLANGGTGSSTRPLFRVSLGSSNQSISASTFVKAQFQDVIYDTTSNWDGTNYRWTPNVAGYYHLSGRLNLVGSSQTRLMCSLAISGSGKSIDDLVVSGYNVKSSLVVYLNGSTDYAELYAWSNGTSPYIESDVGGYRSYFEGFLIQAA